MFIFKNNINLIIVLIFISSCSTLNVTQESVNSENIMTIETSGPKDDYINYDSQAVFANATIYFEFDKSNLTSKSIQTLKSAVNALKENSSIKITLAGHADERGTREYNLALGQRRAEIVSDYLVLNGIQNQRITVKSYGEERPAVIGQDEQSYAKNRRVDIN
ncbi:MAG: peptidoglycan-associated lipoprotein Pal [SAR86 cluster bacterium]|jgi:peptidoglycan-associated lipoprotein|uniref:Peptidoglycan-associated lipoprotein Pal n=1 Tax=SAR86 cluster bacterium TaxID=2030880 RepID=A0A520N225_9GAMM|nr:MAG: peptidoglycan-associated lipoprotein Pal [Gammaproteobacteria bacterium TMED225]RZO27522.1 MAG: peptidoglycan-associated lipoprotein Pal [SAR86 cluster bacterium]